MPWTMWNAPSDRDYYEQFSQPEELEAERCPQCGAYDGDACYPWCGTDISLEEWEEFQESIPLNANEEK